jgi:hypothetical protein
MFSKNLQLMTPTDYIPDNKSYMGFNIGGSFFVNIYKDDAIDTEFLASKMVDAPDNDCYEWGKHGRKARNLAVSILCDLFRIPNGSDIPSELAELFVRDFIANMPEEHNWQINVSTIKNWLRMTRETGGEYES